MNNNFESKIMASAITAAQKQINKGILTIGLDEQLNECFAFRVGKKITPSSALNQLLITWDYNMTKVVEFVLEHVNVAHSGKIFDYITVLED
jgi:hypothetical protein